MSFICKAELNLVSAVAAFLKSSKLKETKTKESNFNKTRHDVLDESLVGLNAWLAPDIQRRQNSRFFCEVCLVLAIFYPCESQADDNEKARQNLALQSERRDNGIIALVTVSEQKNNILTSYALVNYRFCSSPSLSSLLSKLASSSFALVLYSDSLSVFVSSIFSKSSSL